MNYILKIITLSCLLLVITACDFSTKGNTDLVITAQPTAIQLLDSNKGTWVPYTATGGLGISSHYVVMPFVQGHDFSTISSRILDLNNNQFLSRSFTDYNPGLSTMDNNRVFLVRENNGVENDAEINMYDIATDSIVKLPIKFSTHTVKVSNDSGRLYVKNYTLALSDPIDKEIRIYNIKKIAEPILLDSIMYTGYISQLLVANDFVIWSEVKEINGYPSTIVKQYNIVTKQVGQIATEYSTVTDIVSAGQYVAYVGRNRGCVIRKSGLDCNSNDTNTSIVLSDLDTNIIKKLVTKGNFFTAHLALTKDWLGWIYAEGDENTHIEIMHIPSQNIYRFDDSDKKMEAMRPLLITDKELIYLRAPRDFNSTEPKTLQKLLLPKVN